MPKEEKQGKKYNPHPSYEDLPDIKLADGTKLGKRLKAGKFKKTRLGQRYNGKHRD